MKFKNLLFSLGIIGLLVLAVGCGQSVETGDGHSDDVMVGGHVEDDTHMEEGGSSGETVVIDMISRQWEFDPDVIEVNQGDKVEIHLVTEDVAHGIFITGYGVNQRVDPGDDAHINFVANKKGEFPFRCSVACGSGHGTMGGMLIVN
jgi:cytochrome c oxidase subunit 2|tara:strand:- start:7633 stop:8073 length:441 start_codon:yes stop_codon:yes gene_type:complete